jgi:hypothetical protein
MVTTRRRYGGDVRSPRLAVAGLVAVLLVGPAACGDAGEPAASAAAPTTTGTPASRVPATTERTTVAPTIAPTAPATAGTSSLPTGPPPTDAPAAPPAPPPPAPPRPAPAPPAYGATVAGVDASQLPASWRPGCPVGPEQLRLLTLPYWGFDGGEHTGEMVVHADVAADVVEVFRALHAARFPIARMVLVDVYGGDDDASTRANNTSSFNCRPVTGGSSWSQHAYGRAIDVNPVQNPYVYSDGTVADPAAARYTDRSLQEPGMIHDGDVVVDAFTSIGWGWGGRYRSIKDYQHFSATGG